MRSSVRWTSSSARSCPNSNLRDYAIGNSGLFSASACRDNECYRQTLTELREIVESFAKIIAEFKK